MKQLHHFGPEAAVGREVAASTVQNCEQDVSHSPGTALPHEPVCDLILLVSR